MVSECPTPGETPTAGPAPTPGPTTQFQGLQINFFRAITRTDCPENAERTLALWAGGTLCFGLAVLILAVWWQALMNPGGKVDGTLVAAMGVLSSSVAVLAGYIHRTAGPTSTAPQGGAQ